MQKKLEESMPRKKNKDADNDSRVQSPKHNRAPMINDFQQLVSKGKMSMGLPAVGNKIDTRN